MAGNRKDEADSMSKLADIGIVIGHTVTDGIIDAANHLPDAARRELWRGRTLNKQAMAAIVAAVEDDTDEAAPVADETPEGE